MASENNQEKLNNLDGLVKLINNGFQANQEYMDKKFSDIDKKFGNIDQRFDKIDQRLDRVDQRFDRMDKRFDNLETKLDAFVEEYREEKLPMRMEYVENVLNLPKK